MTLGAPLGLLALLAAPALVAAYFLRRRQPPRTVSALFLWRTADLRAEAGPRLQRFSREASLALELLLVAVAALFLSDVRCGPPPERRHLVAVVDGGLSMRARHGGDAVVERVRAALAALLREEGPALVTVVESGVHPRVLAGPRLEAGRALAQLETWSPSQPAHDLAPALTFARDLAGAEGGRVVLFTDGPLPQGAPLPEGVEGRSVGQAADNVALLSAHRRDDGGLASVTVRVGSFAAAEREVEVHLAAEGAGPEVHRLRLAPGATGVLRAQVSTRGLVTVTLPDDALPDDGRVELLPAPEVELGVALADGVAPEVEASVRRLAAIAPGVALAAPAALTVGPRGSSARVTVGAAPPLTSFVGPFFAERTSPLLDDVQLGGVVWTAGQLAPPGRPLLTAGRAVLMSEEDDGTVHLNLDPARSSLLRTAAWPVLLGNLVRHARQALPGFSRVQLALGEEVALVTTAEARWAVQGPDGVARAVPGVGALTLPPFDAPGTWTLLRDGASFDVVGVLPLDAQESDLRTRGPWTVASGGREGRLASSAASPRPWWPLVVMLALLLVDFWVTAAPLRREVVP